MKEQSNKSAEEMKMFKVLIGYDKNGLKDMPLEIPWAMLNEDQAIKNHTQTLTRLNERGGMCVTEILANIYRQYNRDWTVTQDTVDELNKLVVDFLTRNEIPQVKSVDGVLSDHHILGVLNQHGLTPVVKSAMCDYAAPLQVRIAELVAERDRYRQIIECTDLALDHYDIQGGLFIDTKKMLKQALNQKDK